MFKLWPRQTVPVVTEPLIQKGPPWTCRVFKVHPTHVQLEPYPRGSKIPDLPIGLDLTMDYHDPDIFENAGSTLIVKQLISVMDWGWVGARKTELVNGFRETTGSKEMPRVTKGRRFRRET